MYSQRLLLGTLQPIILNLLKENKRMYGYEITQRVKEITNGKIEITEGALYPSLHKMVSDGIVHTEEEFIGKRVRKYYLLTEKGNSLVALKVKEMVDFISTLSLLLHSKKLTE